MKKMFMMLLLILGMVEKMKVLALMAFVKLL